MAGGEVVEGGDLVPQVVEHFDHVGTDVSGAATYEYLHEYELPCCSISVI
jgi:hypothetical protein